MTEEYELPIEGTEYTWDGILDNAKHALRESSMQWSAIIIEKHFPKFKQKILENEDIVKKLKAWRELMNQPALTNQGDIINKFLGQEVDKILGVQK